MLITEDEMKLLQNVAIAYIEGKDWIGTKSFCGKDFYCGYHVPLDQFEVAAKLADENYIRQLAFCVFIATPKTFDAVGLDYQFIEE